jgi:DNA repair protein RadD
MNLRPYQQRAIDQLYQWIECNAGHPCLVLPTGSGKSHIIAELCRDAIQNWPETRILMLTHVKELIEQNASKLRGCWRNAPLGIYSASIRRRQLGEPITFAGIQSIRGKADQVGHVDLIVIDECHLVSHKDEGGYRKLIKDLLAINSHARVIGLTASPYRLGHGMITDKPAIFDSLIEPTSIEELVYLGYLSVLKSKATRETLDASGVKKRGGDYVESELQKAVNTDPLNQSVVNEVISLAGDRKSWLFFCSGVEHAHAVAKCLTDRGVVASCLTGKTSKKDREATIAGFKSGEIKALTNVGVLTTGFDYPDIDLIAMLRPTMSPGLYLQMAGRGLRPKSHTDHCLVLDFAGVVETHGPITAIQPPSKKNEEAGEPPTKQCPECNEIVASPTKTCPGCGYVFPVAERVEPTLRLRDDDIMGIEDQELTVTEWRWRVHTSRTSGNVMPAVTYYGSLLDPGVTEYFPISNGGFAGEKAIKTLSKIINESGSFASVEDELEDIVAQLNLAAEPPKSIKYRRDGKWFRVTSRSFESIGSGVIHDGK